YLGKGYGDFKGDLAEIVANEIQKVQDRYNALLNSNELDNILDEGYKQASVLAQRKIEKVYKKMGFNRIKK
ncbi:MAG: tryptophan--tRNA ligase, partial [Bacilli bacterium]|nr:tryptophan--tRNA ligase [Bacilli bacterium]